MRFTLNWLKRHLDISCSLERLAEALTDLGMEVEEVIDYRPIYTPFKIALIVKVEPHPQAAKLQVCHVQIDADPQVPLLQIVCGASNAREGLKTVLAPLGSIIPKTGQSLQATEIRGILSQGMLCSEEELQLKGQQEGLIELEQSASLSTSFIHYWGLDDAVLEVLISPNRPDCLSVYGIARDLAAAKIGNLKEKSVLLPPLSTGQFPFKCIVEGEANQDCLQIAFRYCKGLENLPSPLWLSHFLMKIGSTPCNFIVDVTNFILYDQGQPLHAYDADKIEGEIYIRYAKRGEALEALNGIVYQLDESFLVIADQQGPIALAGLIGGLRTACGENTKNIVLESALFDRSIVARMGQKLNLNTEARTRFERGVDPLNLQPALDKAVALLLERGRAEISSTTFLQSSSYHPRTFKLNRDHIFLRTSTTIPDPKIRQILNDLGAEIVYETKAELIIKGPSWRGDWEREEDIIEELLRVNGYEQIPSISLPLKPPQAFPSSLISQEKVRYTLAYRGFYEAVTWAFGDEALNQVFSEDQEPPLSLENPMSRELKVMRRSLFPNLLKAAKENINYNRMAISLFEVGPIYTQAAQQNDRVAAIRVKKTRPHWQKREIKADFYTLKADLYCVLESLGLDDSHFQVKAKAPSWYHPGRCLTLIQGPQRVLGSVGQIHPSYLQQIGIEEEIYGFELFLASLPLSKERKKTALIDPPYPSILRDFAFIIPPEVTAQDFFLIFRAVEKNSPHIVFESIELFDVYQGSKLPEGHQSYAFRLKILPLKETLTDKQIKEMTHQIISLADQKLGAKIRDL